MMNSDKGKTGNGNMADKGAANPKATEQTQKMTASQPDTKAQHLHPLTAAIRQRWSSFVDADLKNIKTREDLSAAVQSKYGVTAEQATTQVKEWAVGRQF